jgi:hypothetical protein
VRSSRVANEVVDIVVSRLCLPRVIRRGLVASYVPESREGTSSVTDSPGWSIGVAWPSREKLWAAWPSLVTSMVIGPGWA